MAHYDIEVQQSKRISIHVIKFPLNINHMLRMQQYRCWQRILVVHHEALNTILDEGHRTTTE
ncbi:hypothetical protein [Paraburkholderia saeva]|uniref:Uncharacterized protein n=1 Tax=Paraburkholderia saeva TaxID=2777537 RepID=A0A9N8X2U9_9BURK|nr:hypothetical protein [Paraburkholderia saeva]CAG4913899.1 hypothetical protein LMG31841_04313 [Paraburkholderia saeva]CAG4929124.1 hypothetical protein R52603_05785 [Paraburkholderia saeva]